MSSMLVHREPHIEKPDLFVSAVWVYQISPLDRLRRYLLVQRGPEENEPGKWGMVMETGNPGESMEEIALRGLREELFDNKEIPTTNALESIQAPIISQYPTSEGQINVLNQIFSLHIPFGTSFKLNPEATNYLWVTVDDLAIFLKINESQFIRNLESQLKILVRS